MHICARASQATVEAPSHFDAHGCGAQIRRKEARSAYVLSTAGRCAPCTEARSAYALAVPCASWPYAMRAFTRNVPVRTGVRATLDWASATFSWQSCAHRESHGARKSADLHPTCNRHTNPLVYRTPLLYRVSAVRPIANCDKIINLWRIFYFLYGKI